MGRKEQEHAKSLRTNLPKPDVCKGAVPAFVGYSLQSSVAGEDKAAARLLTTTGHDVPLNQQESAKEWGQ